jgi:hypothetical protein
MNMIKATFLALASAMLISNAASAQIAPPPHRPGPPPGFEARMDQKYDILHKQAEGEYQRNIAEANKLRAEADKIRDAENCRLGKIYVECRASSATEAQTAACIGLRTGK